MTRKLVIACAAAAFAGIIATASATRAEPPEADRALVLAMGIRYEMKARDTAVVRSDGQVLRITGENWLEPFRYEMGRLSEAELEALTALIAKHELAGQAFPPREGFFCGNEFFSKVVVPHEGGVTVLERVSSGSYEHDHAAPKEGLEGRKQAFEAAAREMLLPKLEVVDQARAFEALRSDLAEEGPLFAEALVLVEALRWHAAPLLPTLEAALAREPEGSKSRLRWLVEHGVRRSEGGE